MELIALMIFCKEVQERAALDLTKLYIAFNISYLQRGRVLSLQIKMNGQVLAEIHLLENHFFP